MANKGGRPQALIWEKFVKVTRDGKSLARCSVCEHELVSRPERMTKHWQTVHDPIIRVIIT